MGRGYALVLVPAPAGRCDCLYLLNYSLARINLVDHCKKALHLGSMTRQDFELFNEVVPALGCQEGQLVNLVSIARLRQF